MNRKQVIMPRIGTNDDLVILTEWLVTDGQKVARQQEIASLETTKKTAELYSPADGYIHLSVCAGEEYEVGAELAVIDECAADLTDLKTAPQEAGAASGPNMTRKARELVNQYGIEINCLPKNRMIREKDILELIGKTGSIAEVTGNQVVIYGTGGFAREIIHVIRQTNAYRPMGVISGIGDMGEADQILGVPVLKSRELDNLYSDGCQKVINAMAVTPNAVSRREIYMSLKKKNFDFPNIIHRNAEIGSGTVMGEGNLILAGAFIGTEAVLGSDCIINVNATVSHQCVISDHCHIASGAVLAGGVTVGENTLIGQGCTIYQDVMIGKNVVIQNGCSVYKNVPDGSVVKA